MPFVAFITGLTMPVVLFLLSPFIGGAFGGLGLNSIGRAFLAANTVYVLAVLAITWALQVSPQLAGPAANVGSILGVTFGVMVMSGARPTWELGAVTLFLVLGAIWAYFALGRAMA